MKHQDPVRWRATFPGPHLGSRSVHDSFAGGQILAQDAATSVVWGMPGFVVNAGLADTVLPLGLLAGEIVRRVGVGRLPEIHSRQFHVLKGRGQR
ncbi:MAG: chemotaxis protein CheB [Acidobacteriaceae bacterium]